MINISDLNKNFNISSIYKNDYICVHTVYNYDFELFYKTLGYLNKQLSEFITNDSNLINFLRFYYSFSKICIKIPINFSENAEFNETNKSFDYNKKIKFLIASYPGHEEDFTFINKKYLELKDSKVIPFFSSNIEKQDDKNLFLIDCELNKQLIRKYKFFKNLSFFYRLYDRKLETITLFNASVELLQEIAYLNIAENINVYNFDWIKKDYSQISYFISHSNIKIRPIKIKIIQSVKPPKLLDNKLLGQIVEEDIILSSDLDEIIQKIERTTKEEEQEINDAALKEKNNLEKIRATIVQLSNGKIAFLRNEPSFDQMQDVVVKSITEKIETISKKVDLIKIGEFLVFKGERATSMLEQETTIMLEKTADYFYSQRREWKHRLEQEINRLGLDKVIKKIQEFGGRKKIFINNIRYWLYPKSLRTEDKVTFFSIMKLCGLHNNADEIWNNMGELEKAHLQAGRRIKNKIKETISKSNITQLLKKGFQEFSLSSKGGGSLQVYKIIEKGKTLKVKFSYTDKPLDPKEFLK